MRKPLGNVHYVSALEALTALSGLNRTGRELDRYLWLRGLHEAWTRNPKAEINVEARGLFERAARDGDVGRDLAALVGQG